MAAGGSKSDHGASHGARCSVCAAAYARAFQVEDDARRAVDVQLKTACECLIFDVSHQLSAPVMMLHAQMESATPLAVDAEVMKQALAATHDAIVEDGASAGALSQHLPPHSAKAPAIVHRSPALSLSMLRLTKRRDSSRPCFNVYTQSSDPKCSAAPHSQQHHVVGATIGRCSPCSRTVR